MEFLCQHWHIFLLLVFLIPFVINIITGCIRLFLIRYNEDLWEIVENLRCNYFYRISWIALFLLFLALFTVQKMNNFTFININDLETIELLGFIIAIFTMYGIYIAFLQFVSQYGGQENKYMGRIKTTYILDSSIWFYVSQTGLFLMILFLSVILPILMKTYEFDGFLHHYILYTWQTCILVLVIIYIFLINTSLRMIRYTLLIKERRDHELEKEINTSIKRRYRKLHNDMIMGESDFFIIALKKDINQIDTVEIGHYLQLAFKPFYNKFIITDMEKYLKKWYYKKMFAKKEFHTDRLFGKRGQVSQYCTREFFNIYKEFVQNKKWVYLKSINENIDYSVFEDLVLLDITIFYELLKMNPEQIKANINEFLFEQLLCKAKGKNMDKLCKAVKDSTTLHFVAERYNEDLELNKYYEDLERYKWEKILRIHINEESDFELPKFSDPQDWLLSKSKMNTVDSDISNFYSGICFYFLIEHVNVKENFEQNRKIKNLIMGMNRVYRVAYMLYQFLYPDSDGCSWDENMIFCAINLKSALCECSLDEEGKKELFLCASNKVANTQRVGHRITKNVFCWIYNTQNDQIKDMDYFREYPLSRIEPLQLIFLQSILSDEGRRPYYSSNRINIENISSENYRDVGLLCEVYLRATSKQIKLRNFDNFTGIMHKFIKNHYLKIEFNANDLSIKSLLYYEYILKCQLIRDYKNVLIGLFKHEINGEIFFRLGDGGLKFFIAKLDSDNYTKGIFNDEDFKREFHIELENALKRLNMTSGEFVGNIYHELSDIKEISISKIEVERISMKLQKILYE